MLNSKNVELKNRLSNLKSDKQNLLEIAKYWHEQSKEVIIDNVHLLEQNKALKDKYSKLEEEFNALLDDFTVLQEEYEFCLNNYKKLNKYKSYIDNL